MSDEPRAPTICPETREPCLEAPACDLRNLGRVYCCRWVARICAEGAAELKKGNGHG